MPYIGCYGALPEVRDQGAGMLSALASIIDATDEKEAEKFLKILLTQAGFFYMFSMANLILRRAKR